MKKTVLPIIIVVCVSLFAVSVASAAGKSRSFSLDLEGYSTFASETSDVLDSGNFLEKQVYVSASSALSATDATADLVGNYSGKVWLFEESEDNIEWNAFASLIDSSTALAYASSFSNYTSALPYSTSSRYFRISYDVGLYSGAPASASGTAAMSVMPEPSGILLIIVGSAGLLRYIRRRR